MNRQKANEKLDEIRRLAEELEEDEELKGIDERYSILAMWIETDLDTVSI